MNRRAWLAIGLLLSGCGEEAPPPMEAVATEEQRGFAPPVVTNAESPVAYPVVAYETGVEGTVILRLYADERGAVVPESTRIAEGSGHAVLDSAAAAGVHEMRFAPARRDGTPVASAFLQPVHFRHPDRPSSGGQP